MRTESRLLLSLAAILLVPVFFLPLWSIRIVAPQYREGLGMFIGLRDIWGHTEHDIQNINILNHYIGMKPIDPAVVDLLTIMPKVVALLAAAAAIVALVGRRKLVIGWLVAFAGLGTAGMVEFYRWNHDYGHNLSPMAPIKIPGMTYQPPMLGTKQLLNMTTSSLPSWGTLFVALAFAAGVLALVNEYRPLFRRRSAGDGGAGARGGATRLSAAAGAIVLLVVAGACSGPQQASADGTRPVPQFAAGEVSCDYCDGIIPAERFGGEVETRDGTTYRFMSTECMAGFLVEERVPAASVRAIRVVDYNQGERLIDATRAKYVRMQFAKSPSGLNLAAVETEKVANSLHYFMGGEQLGWDEVLDLVRREWNL